LAKAKTISREDHHETQLAVGEMYTGDLASDFSGFAMYGVITSLNYVPATFFQ